MDDSSIGLLFGAITFLIVLSAYFSGSETAMMALNRFRLKHLANEGYSGAKLASKLLERPDRLLSVILIGNNLVNFSAASLATLLAIKAWGEGAVIVAPIVCTLVFLIFAEVAPKTISAAYPEKIALPSAYMLQILLVVLFPLVWLVNGFANAMLRLVGIRHEEIEEDSLSAEELRTVVFEGSKIADHSQNMMLGVLDLAKVTVEDIMVPRAEIFAIDIEDKADDIVRQLKAAQHTRVPVFRGNIENIVGVLHLRDTAKFLTEDKFNRASILLVTEEPYFVPENTPLQIQLVNFQKNKKRIGMVVDEYGDIQGIVTMGDILEEIVGKFPADIANTNVEIRPQEDGSFIIDGSAHLRLINRTLNWELPLDGPKTLSGLIIEMLEIIPASNVCVIMEAYRIEVVQMHDNMVRTAKVSETPEPF